MNERLIYSRVAFISHNQSSEVADPGDRSLDLPPAFISSQLSTILGFGFLAILSMGANQLDSLFRKSCSKGVRIGGSIVDQSFDPPLRVNGRLLEGRFDELDFARGRRGKLYSQRNTLAVCHHHKLRTLSTLGFSDSVPPFFAGENVPSAKTSAQLI